MHYLIFFFEYKRIEEDEANKDIDEDDEVPNSMEKNR